MKKIIVWWVSICVISIWLIAAAGFYKFNILEDDIYVAWEDGNVVKYNDIIQVSSSIIPISSVVNAVGWDFVEVNTIIPAWVSPHWFDLSPKDVVALEKSDITFLIGLEQIDGFLEKALQNKKHKELAEWIELIEAAAYDHDEHSNEEHEDIHHDEDHHDDEHEDEEHENTHDKHSTDPHIWLGKENIFSIAEIIRNELSLILPEQEEYFAENTKAFQIDIESLYTDFTEKNTGKTPKEFIVFHDAYNYMMQSIGMNLNLKVPFSENVLHEAGTGHMVELIQEIELHGVKYVFREPQFTDGTLQKFVDEYDLTLATLDPLGTDPSPTWYRENIKTNLNTLSLVYE